MEARLAWLVAGESSVHRHEVDKRGAYFNALYLPSWPVTGPPTRGRWCPRKVGGAESIARRSVGDLRSGFEVKVRPILLNPLRCVVNGLYALHYFRCIVMYCLASMKEDFV